MLDEIREQARLFKLGHTSYTKAIRVLTAKFPNKDPRLLSTLLNNERSRLCQGKKKSTR